jgi:carbamate kinase
MEDKKPLAVIAFGGNALVPDADHLSVHDQYGVVKDIGEKIANLVDGGWNVLITHGNGPQVGFVMRRTELAIASVAPLTMDYAVANTQGVIGHMFVLSLQNEYAKRNRGGQAMALVCQTLVDRDDPAFADPSKPIGSWYEKEQAEELAARYGWTVVEDSGRGWRRVVPSPAPRGIVQLPAIQALVEQGFTVVALGGGGIPVAETGDGELEGVEAVIDKDLATSLLAQKLKADVLVFPTSVERVALGFNTPSQRWLDRMTLKEAENHRRSGEFPKGSMEPKVAALMEFVRETGNPGVITNLANLEKALSEREGTWLVP